MNTNTEEVRKILKWVWIVLVVLAIFLAAQALGAIKDLRSVNPMYNSISVSGEGEAVSVPDVATFSFTVSADARVASGAQSRVTEKMNVILASLKNLGIEEKDINTTDYSLWPKYTYEVAPAIYPPFPGKQVQDGYTASHHVSIKVRDTEMVGEALAVAGENGATGLSSISFTVDDPDKIIEEARAEAIADAREKARELARELGVRLVRIVSFYENNAGGPMPYYAEGLGMDMTRSSTAPAPTIPIGENKVKVNVTVEYEIR
ncbi:MAG: SIMPL domain-containing protein [Parcubacteria group bacterium]